MMRKETNNTFKKGKTMALATVMALSLLFGNGYAAATVYAEDVGVENTYENGTEEGNGNEDPGNENNGNGGSDDGRGEGAGTDSGNEGGSGISPCGEEPESKNDAK